MAPETPEQGKRDHLEGLLHERRQLNVRIEGLERACDAQEDPQKRMDLEIELGKARDALVSITKDIKSLDPAAE